MKVKDNITNETVDLRIKITDSYLAYAIEKSNHPALSNGTVVYLINNEAKECYFSVILSLETNYLTLQ